VAHEVLESVGRRQAKIFVSLRQFGGRQKQQCQLTSVDPNFADPGVPPLSGADASRGFKNSLGRIRSVKPVLIHHSLHSGMVPLLHLYFNLPL